MVGPTERQTIYQELKETFDPDSYILVVDDSITTRNLLTAMLRELGFFNVLQEANGLRALEVLQKMENPVSLVFSDWRMEGLTGLGLLVRVRADKNLKSLAFVMVTGAHELENVKFAIKAGVDGYLLKPFTVADLKEKLISTAQTVRKKTPSV